MKRWGLTLVAIAAVVGLAIFFLKTDLGAERINNPAFTPEQRRWEQTLADNLGSFYYPIYLQAKLNQQETAWDFVEDREGLPAILIVGDSISRGCTIPIRKYLLQEANVHRAPENCSATSKGVKKIDIWLAERRWDLIVFNFGIHDRNTDSKTYAKNLRTILKKMKNQSDRMLWLTTTPVPEGANEYVEGAIDRVNSVATPLMEANGIPTFDLHAKIRPRLKEFQKKRNCHFNKSGYQFMGELIAKEISSQLKLSTQDDALSEQ